MKQILPGSSIGVLGSGQLGRMLAMAARRMGYGVRVYSPDKKSPAGQIADEEVVGEYDDLDKIAKFAKKSDVITFEFENVSFAAAQAAEKYAPTRPGPMVLHTTQNRLREKTFLQQNGFPTVAFRAVASQEELETALGDLGTPAVLKTAGFGYDGKGQVKIESLAEAGAAWEQLGGQQCVLEAWAGFEREVSMVAARGLDGSFAHFGIFENTHANHILDTTLADGARSREAEEITRGIFEKLEIVGTACVEFFRLPNGRLLVNEIAPRPHNSGHLTIEACVTSQFEQQLRAICGLPLGSTRFVAPAAMANLLGDHLIDPDYDAVLRLSEARLHLYGKEEPRLGRKMGHITALGRSGAHALAVAKTARRALSRFRLPMPEFETVTADPAEPMSEHADGDAPQA
jgi:5-(carboxyamino)imidazole ribonucleotide synthase